MLSYHMQVLKHVFNIALMHLSVACTEQEAETRHRRAADTCNDKMCPAGERATPECVQCFCLLNN